MMDDLAEILDDLAEILDDLAEILFQSFLREAAVLAWAGMSIAYCVFSHCVFLLFLWFHWLKYFYLWQGGKWFWWKIWETAWSCDRQESMRKKLILSYTAHCRMPRFCRHRFSVLQPVSCGRDCMQVASMLTPAVAKDYSKLKKKKRRRRKRKKEKNLWVDGQIFSCCNENPRLSACA